jgi:hypothetical protein
VVVLELDGPITRSVVREQENDVSAQEDREFTLPMFLFYLGPNELDDPPPLVRTNLLSSDSNATFVKTLSQHTRKQCFTSYLAMPYASQLDT